MSYTDTGKSFYELVSIVKKKKKQYSEFYNSHKKGRCSYILFINDFTEINIVQTFCI